MRSLRVAVPLLIVLALALWCAPAQAERRVALVIGNGAYKTASLKNPTNDAQDMAAALSEMGFDVTLRLNASLKDMEEAVRAFGVKLKQGGLGLFYYAGHGVQVAGENYLIPVDTKVEAEADVKFGALNAGLALARMEDAGNDLNIVILDACRTNPFARNFRTVEQGLARMDAPKGSLIAYATAPGRVAADSGSSGRNGVYTGFLLRHMRDPGLKVEEVLKRVRADVVRATKDKQVPWESSSLMGDFYFVSGTQVASLGQSAQVAAPLDLAAEKQRNAEEAVRLKREQQELTQIQAEKQRLEAERQKLEQAKFLTLAPMPSKGSSYTEVERFMASARDAVNRGDHADAMKWYKLAAERGDAQAQYKLGYEYDNGKIVPKNYREAAKWFRLSAEQGVADAQYHLAVLYSAGAGVKQDPNEAHKWELLAANGGNVASQYSLAVSYLSGFYSNMTIKKDYKEALKWASLAAESNDRGAQEILATMNYFGNGVSVNYIQAYKWFIIADTSGNSPIANIMQKTTSHMTPEQIDDAKRLAEQWKSNFLKRSDERAKQEWKLNFKKITQQHLQ